MKALWPVTFLTGSCLNRACHTRPIRGQ